MDTAGVTRFAYGMDKNEQQRLYVADAAGEQWRQVPAGSVGGVFTPIGFSADGANVFGLHAADNGPQVLIKASLDRSEEHTSELQSLMRISYAVFCLKKKKKTKHNKLQEHNIDITPKNYS